MNPAAPHYLPVFITMPGQTDTFMVAMAIFVLLAVIGIGVFYLRLHALPEQLAHRGQKMQFEIVAVLALLALFTHNHAFWIAGLLLALIPLPDFTTPLMSMARSLRKMATADRAVLPAAREAQAAPPQPKESSPPPTVGEPAIDRREA